MRQIAHSAAIGVRAEVQTHGLQPDQYFVSDAVARDHSQTGSADLVAGVHGLPVCPHFVCEVFGLELASPPTPSFLTALHAPLRFVRVVVGDWPGVLPAAIVRTCTTAVRVCLAHSPQKPELRVAAKRDRDSLEMTCVYCLPCRNPLGADFALPLPRRPVPQARLCSLALRAAHVALTAKMNICFVLVVWI
jgi:hypothetical protein